MSHTVCTFCKKNWIFDDANCCRVCKKKLVATNEIMKIAQSGIDIESIKNNISELMINNQLRLDDHQIKLICDAYYNSGKLTQERLTDADNLYLQLHHNNGMIL